MRHGLQDDDACVLCDQEPEACDHLFLGCVVTREFWHALLSPIGLELIAPRRDDELADWWLRSRGVLNAEARPAFDLVLLLMAWCVWKERNSRTFNGTAAGMHAMVLAVLREAEDWISVGISPLIAALAMWSQSSNLM
jgi:hypothetical protein